MSEYASHYKQGGIETADKIEKVCKFLNSNAGIRGDKIADVAHVLKYFDRAGFKGDADEGVEMRIGEMDTGEHIIVVDPPYAWSIPINYCPFCGRDFNKEDK